MLWNVRDHGAVGNGDTNDTAALQRAVDACSNDGGGRVLVPAGIYRMGTLYLRSHVDLHLEPGAVLLGSGERGDYNADDLFPENQAFASEQVSGAHLIIAYRAENVSISGQGAIDGHSSCFFGPLPADRVASYRYKNGNFTIADWRPGQMVFFCRCREIRVTDVTLRNSPYWTLFFLGCENVHARGLSITNPPATANGDGIDIDCSRNVTVSDCIISTGDDCITLRGNCRPLGEDLPCEDVTVTNCVLRTPCNAVRIGVGDGTVRHCRLGHLLMPETRTGFNIVSRYSARVPRGTRIEGIDVSDVSMNAITPIQLIVGHGAVPPAGIRNLTFTRFRVHAEAGGYAGGNPDLPVENLRLSEWDISLAGGSDNDAFADTVPYPYRIHGFHGQDGQPALPAALYVTHARNLALDRIRVRWNEPLGRAWRNALRLDHATDIHLCTCVFQHPVDQGAGTAVRCENCGNILLTDCHAMAETKTFLKTLHTAAGARIAALGCDLSAADIPFDTDRSVEQSGTLT